MLNRNSSAAGCLSLLVALFVQSPCTLAVDTPQRPASIASLVRDHRTVDGIFFHVLPQCPDSGWSSIPLPRLAESLLSSRIDDDGEHVVPLAVLGSDPDASTRIQAGWTRAVRGVPSKVRFSGANRLMTGSAGSVLLITRSTAGSPDVGSKLRLQVFAAAQNPEYELLLAHFGLTPDDVRPGMFGIQAPWSPRGPPLRSEALSAFLEKFDRVAAQRFVPTLRSGSTGIGYTLETLLDIPENNHPTGDFLGMELKAHRGNDLESLSSKKMNLFLKEPAWTDGLAHRERIPRYGYVDNNGRVALYSTVTVQQNSHGLALKVSPDRERLELLVKGRGVAWWSREILESRLQEKLTETAFVGAATSGSGRDEEFHFQTVLYCEQPSVDAFLQLIESRDVMLEMRMHIREDGSARNHGTAFRIRLDQLPRLFGRTVLMRSVDAQSR